MGGKRTPIRDPVPRVALTMNFAWAGKGLSGRRQLPLPPIDACAPFIPSGDITAWEAVMRSLDTYNDLSTGGSQRGITESRKAVALVKTPSCRSI